MTFDSSVTLFGQTYTNPVLAASGTFGCGEIYNDLLDYSKIGGFVTKAVTTLPRTGNQPQRIIETPSGMLNAIGLQNEGLESFIKEKLPKFADYQCRVWVNVSGATFEEYLNIVDALDKYPQISAFEINVSCPNVDHGGMTIGTSADQVHTLTEKIKKHSSKPIVVKLSPNVTNIGEIAIAAADAQADALTVGNTFLGMAIDIEKAKPVLGHITGGLSGSAIKPLALRCVWQVRNAVKIPIIGCGGISTGVDAVEFLMAGATMIQVGTAIFKNPTSPSNIAFEIASWADNHSYKNVSELTGIANICQK